MCCILFENYIYKCAGASDLLYSYTNAHGFWLKGFYLPINPQDAPPAGDPRRRTVYCLYVGTCQQELVGFVRAANYDSSNMVRIKETLELTSFLIGAVIVNHQLVSHLERMGTIDVLTQVSNRNAMDARTAELVSREASRPAALGIVLADLNGLKPVNDSKGHSAGDKLLKKAAALLKIAFGDDEIYRVGGDEFVILCPDITEEALAQQTAQLRALADNTPDVSFAVGAAWCTGDYDIATEMQNADERMYRDKAEYYRLHPEKNRR